MYKTRQIKFLKRQKIYIKDLLEHKNNNKGEVKHAAYIKELNQRGIIVVLD